MSEPLKRRNLLQAVSSPAPSLPDQAIAAVAARNGYPDISPTAPPASIADHSAHVGSVSPQAEITNSTAAAGNTGFIYAQANERNIPVAQVIEDKRSATRPLTDRADGQQLKLYRGGA